MIARLILEFGVHKQNKAFNDYRLINMDGLHESLLE